MKRYIKSSTGNMYYYNQLNKDAKEIAIWLFQRWMLNENKIQLTDNDAERVLEASNSLFNEDGYTVDKNGNSKAYYFTVPDNWQDYLIDEFSGKLDKRKWFDNCLKNGTINYNKHLGGFIYEYSDAGFTDEIFIGETEEEAFKTFCEINW